MKRILLDAGPLVAFLNRRDRHHEWARGVLDSLAPPLYTCESVLSEACFLVRNLDGGPDAVLSLLERGLIEARFSVESEVAAVRKLMAKYADVPMSLADACLVRMSELEPESIVLTVDSGFRHYRRHRRKVIQTIMPTS